MTNKIASHDNKFDKKNVFEKENKKVFCVTVCVFSFRVILSDQLSKRNEQFVTAQWAISTAISKTWHFTKCYLFTFYYVKYYLFCKPKLTASLEKLNLGIFVSFTKNPFFVFWPQNLTMLGGYLQCIFLIKLWRKITKNCRAAYFKYC